MKRLLLVLGMLVCSLSGGAATTLKEAFEASKLNMENLKRAGAIIDQAEERKTRARAALLPTISGVGNETRIDKPSASGVNSAFVLTRQYSAGLRLTQPLLRGGSLSAYQLADEDILLSKFQKNATELNLYQLVINAYYNLFMAEVDLKNIKELNRLSQERVKELRSRTSVGRSRKGELVQAEAQLLTSQSSIQNSEINLVNSQANFEFFTGMKPVGLAELTLMPRELEDIANYLNKVQDRPDIRARRQEINLAEKRIGVAKGGHYPQLDLISNYYFDRTGVLATSEWDVAVVVNVPLFQGGGVQAGVREQVEIKRVAELDALQTKRAAERDLTILYRNFLQIQGQLDTLKHAVTKAEEGYKLNRRDYQNGQATNLDVLQSLNVFIESKRTYDNLLVLSHMTYKNLEASIGVLP